MAYVDYRKKKPQTDPAYKVEVFKDGRWRAVKTTRDLAIAASTAAAFSPVKTRILPIGAQV